MRKSKGKNKGLGTCYSAAVVASQTHGQQRFTISEVAGDQLMVLQRPSIAAPENGTRAAANKQATASNIDHFSSR